VVSFRALAAVAVLAACGGGGSGDADRPVPGAQPAAHGSVVDSACPATGLWAECSVLERLERSGLAPQRRGEPATRPPLTAEGLAFGIGRGELEVYIYPDEDARLRDQAGLDTTMFVAAHQQVSLRNEPTLIASGNLIAVLRSASERQRERVSDALTAGAPQPR
jgi:hypothetical protein